MGDLERYGRRDGDGRRGYALPPVDGRPRFVRARQLRRRHLGHAASDGDRLAHRAVDRAEDAHVESHGDERQQLPLQDAGELAGRDGGDGRTAHRRHGRLRRDLHGGLPPLRRQLQQPAVRGALRGRQDGVDEPGIVRAPRGGTGPPVPAQRQQRLELVGSAPRGRRPRAREHRASGELRDAEGVRGRVACRVPRHAHGRQAGAGHGHQLQSPATTLTRCRRRSSRRDAGTLRSRRC